MTLFPRPYSPTCDLALTLRSSGLSSTHQWVNTSSRTHQLWDTRGPSVSHARIQPYPLVGWHQLQNSQSLAARDPGTGFQSPVSLHWLQDLPEPSPTKQQANARVRTFWSSRATHQQPNSTSETSWVLSPTPVFNFKGQHQLWDITDTITSGLRN